MTMKQLPHTIQTFIHAHLFKADAAVEYAYGAFIAIMAVVTWAVPVSAIPNHPDSTTCPLPRTPDRDHSCCF